MAIAGGPSTGRCRPADIFTVSCRRSAVMLQILTSVLTLCHGLRFHQGMHVSSAWSCLASSDQAAPTLSPDQLASPVRGLVTSPAFAECLDQHEAPDRSHRRDRLSSRWAGGSLDPIPRFGHALGRTTTSDLRARGLSSRRTWGDRRGQWRRGVAAARDGARSGPLPSWGRTAGLPAVPRPHCGPEPWPARLPPMAVRAAARGVPPVW